MITYAGGTTPLVGSGIPVGLISGIGTLAHSGEHFQVLDGNLNFITGDFDFNTATTWVFEEGGSITLTGGVDLNGDGDTTDAADIPNATTLFSGTFTSVTVFDLPGEDSAETVGSLSIDLNDALRAFFLFFPDEPVIGSLDLFHFPAGPPPLAFSSRPSAGFITVGEVPEPVTLALIGYGLVGLVIARRCRIC